MLMFNSLTEFAVVFSLLPLLLGLARVAYGGTQ
jgi:hypothetical protein